MPTSAALQNSNKSDRTRSPALLGLPQYWAGGQACLTGRLTPQSSEQAVPPMLFRLEESVERIAGVDRFFKTGRVK